MKINEKKLIDELNFKAVLSSGPGGQHANTTSSKVVLEWALLETHQFSDSQITQLKKRLKPYLNKENILQLSCEETRSQHQNKTLVTARFLKLINTGLKKRKKRKPPKPGKKFHKKRLEQKKQQAEKKKNRQNPLS